MIFKITNWIDFDMTLSANLSVIETFHTMSELISVNITHQVLRENIWEC